MSLSIFAIECSICKYVVNYFLLCLQLLYKPGLKMKWWSKYLCTQGIHQNDVDIRTRAGNVPWALYVDLYLVRGIPLEGDPWFRLKNTLPMEQSTICLPLLCLPVPFFQDDVYIVHGLKEFPPGFHTIVQDMGQISCSKWNYWLPVQVSQKSMFYLIALARNNSQVTLF